ncbi:hypothetical protein BSZ35_04140 [Salinibacter sp. 10B]|uniref:hypothetical protein n=1 Tax=Salinibacter sp. 10B TaxID=1923971 RepID=UPI000CF52234|nr:hypothetical protein [Salinibacter sp. 10B]PQJ33900.1 hypothetical protein BSZ35_04140 [Salinibacter sp. 10B]
MRKELNIIREPTEKEEKYIRLFKIFRSLTFVFARVVSVFVFVSMFFIEKEVQKIGLFVTSSIIAYCFSYFVGTTSNISYEGKGLVSLEGELSWYAPAIAADAEIDNIPIILPAGLGSQVIPGQNKIEGYMDDAGVLYAVKIERPPLSVEEDLPSFVDFLLRFM